MDYSQQFFAQHEAPITGIYPSPKFQAIPPGFDKESYELGVEHQDPNAVSTHPMHKPIIPSLEEAAEAEDISTRPRLTQEQIAVLEDNFKSKPKPGTDFKKQLATSIGLSLQRVNVSKYRSYSSARTDPQCSELVPKPSCEGKASKAAGTEVRCAPE